MKLILLMKKDQKLTQKIRLMMITLRINGVRMIDHLEWEKP